MTFAPAPRSAGGEPGWQAVRYLLRPAGTLGPWLTHPPRRSGGDDDLREAWPVRNVQHMQPGDDQAERAVEALTVTTG